MGHMLQTVLTFLFALVILAAIADGQTRDGTIPEGKSPCRQTKQETIMSINEADRSKFITRRIEFWGNVLVHDRELRKYVAKGLSEGDIFSREAIEAAVKQLSRVKSIYPITMESIEVRLDRLRTDVDLIFCVRERQKQ